MQLGPTDSNKLNDSSRFHVTAHASLPSSAFHTTRGWQLFLLHEWGVAAEK